MNGLIWVGHAALAAIFLTSGTFKLFASAPLMRLIMKRADIHIPMKPLGAKILGLIEVLLALGTLMPDIFTADGMVSEYVIVRLCATGLGLLMIGAAIYHARRKQHASLDATIFLLALFVIVGRWPF